MTIYRPYIGSSIGSSGVKFWIQEATEERVGDRTFVRVGRTLREDRDDWHETQTAAMDEAAVQIEQLARDLTAQAATIRSRATALRTKQADDDERYDRGLPPRMEVPE